MKRYADLNLKAIREECDLDFAHFTYKPGQCSCCYSPKDLPSIYWKDRVIPGTKDSYYGFLRESKENPLPEEARDTEYEYLLFKNADNGRGHVKSTDEIKGKVYVEWGFPMEKLPKVCNMLQEQLGDGYRVIAPASHSTCIIIEQIEANTKAKANVRRYLLEQGVWEREINEVLEDFSDDVTENDVNIEAIYDTAFDLGEHYIDNVIGTLDQNVDAVLDYSELGRHIADNNDEYLSLTSGRIIEFRI